MQGRVALITGGAGGIGLAIARRFSTDGASVAIADINASAGMAAEQDIRAGGGAVRFIEMDLARAEDAPRTVDATVDAFGRVDILVNCAAAFGERKPLVEVSLEDWEQVIRTNLTGTFLITQAAVHRMLEQGGGIIINILAIQPMMPVPLWGPYATSKGGLYALNRALAVELAGKGIRVNGIAVGSIYTDAVAGVLGEPSHTRELDHASAALVGRMGRGEDIAGVAAFLASDDASYLAGAIIPADGGRLLSRKPDPFVIAQKKSKG